MQNPTLEVTVTGTPVCVDVAGSRPLTNSQFATLVDRIAECVHDEVSDACVSGQADTGEIEVWFLVQNAKTFHTGMRRAADVAKRISHAVESAPLGSSGPAKHGTGSGSALLKMNAMTQQCRELADSPAAPA